MKKNKGKKPKKPAFDVLFKNICGEEKKVDAEPVTADDVWHFFHESKQTSRGGGGTLKSKNTLRSIAVDELISFTMRVMASGKYAQKMYAACHYAYTVTKVPLGQHLLTK